LTIEEDANMPTCNLFEMVHNTWLQQSSKKGKDLFNATIDNLVRALEHHTWYRMHFTGKLKGKGPNHIELQLWKKCVFYNWPCNSIFELHQTFATHHIYIL
jgi:hypothetical protein